ncbi:6-phosphogluconate dehydrogenase [Paenibacillus sp. J31TS4]|uniref:phosphogluconate dehydrogenase (NAD(+)-dependent, decarboxylating) n=1 Tax=Paenibacillus sp. J31TS4 TaxID=2807195 RepID=UPI001B254959|nr:decarboxylating 6-phosphogluconate dehydrogenase [Paenibacillus sp. J31TS4]GIP38041.1 6-phosphogluconate dehydrogenase [Paenibacillus sp. J31TS4]
MKLGMIGLGKMGSNLVKNLLEQGHEVVVYDRDPALAEELRAKGAEPADSLADLAGRLQAPRTVWVMVPAGGPVESVVGELAELLEPGDRVIEGGNSHYRDSIRHAALCADKGIAFLDCGTSGGMEGARHGGCMMVGGEEEAFRQVEPLFASLCVPGGYLYTGKPGSGHFLKMVHNGIEYGMMQAVAEGFEVLDKSEFGYDFEQVARVWSNGSVIRGWLMELAERAFSKDAKLETIRGVMHSSGEGRWTVETALELQASAPVIAMSLFMRYRSLEDDTFHGKVVAALRNEFGGHSVEKSDS